MLLIAEIILTIFAWRAGWKWLALLKEKNYLKNIKNI
jgi:hypothetical protein